MKKYVLSIVLGLMSLASFAQSAQYIEVNIRWNATTNRYEVYMRPNFTKKTFNVNTTGLHVVTPASVTNAVFSNFTPAIVTYSDPSNGGAITQNSTAFSERPPIASPAAQPQNDFHFILTQGFQVDVVAGQEFLVYSFTLDNGQCLPGLRMFRNYENDPANNYIPSPTPDPTSAASGMQGADFNNNIYDENVVNFYRTYYGNELTTCPNCITAPELIKQ